MDDERPKVKFRVTCLGCGKRRTRSGRTGHEAIPHQKAKHRTKRYVGETTIAEACPRCGGRDYRAEPV